MQHETVARSRNHCCYGRAISITHYILRVFLALVKPAFKENALYYTTTCGLCSFIIFFHIISQTARLSEENFLT